MRPWTSGTGAQRLRSLGLVETAPKELSVDSATFAYNSTIEEGQRRRDADIDLQEKQVNAPKRVVTHHFRTNVAPIHLKEEDSYHSSVYFGSFSNDAEISARRIAFLAAERLLARAPAEDFIIYERSLCELSLKETEDGLRVLVSAFAFDKGCDLWQRLYAPQFSSSCSSAAIFCAILETVYAVSESNRCSDSTSSLSLLPGSSFLCLNLAQKDCSVTRANVRRSSYVTRRSVGKEERSGGLNRFAKLVLASVVPILIVDPAVVLTSSSGNNDITIDQDLVTLLHLVGTGLGAGQSWRAEEAAAAIQNVLLDEANCSGSRRALPLAGLDAVEIIAIAAAAATTRQEQKS